MALARLIIKDEVNVKKDRWTELAVQEKPSTMAQHK
jgi:hypothetical protein